MSDSDQESNEKRPEAGRNHGPFRAMFSVMAAFFGVQSSANRDRDDSHGNVVHFVLFGLVATIVLVSSIVLFVNLLIAQAG